MSVFAGIIIIQNYLIIIIAVNIRGLYESALRYVGKIVIITSIIIIIITVIIKDGLLFLGLTFQGP